MNDLHSGSKYELLTASSTSMQLLTNREVYHILYSVSSWSSTTLFVMVANFSILQVQGHATDQAEPWSINY